MPVRSSVCTYSPSSVSNSKYSTVLPKPSSLSVGHYKPLSSSTLGGKSSYGSGDSTISGSNTLGSYGSSRYTLSTSSYSPSSSLGSNSYNSLSSTSTNYSPSSPGHYRPLSSAHNSFTGSRYGNSNTLGSTGSSYTRYSSASSTGSTSSSSLSSASSLLDRTDIGGYSSSISNYSYHPSTATTSRRLSYTVSVKAANVPCTCSMHEISGVECHSSVDCCCANWWADDHQFVNYWFLLFHVTQVCN